MKLFTIISMLNKNLEKLSIPNINNMSQLLDCIESHFSATEHYSQIVLKNNASITIIVIDIFQSGSENLINSLRINAMQSAIQCTVTDDEMNNLFGKAKTYHNLIDVFEWVINTIEKML